ncbi:hypothetical protein [Amycolatopsis australiensis]|uniref:Uncharacterized protein n=1 Tax=Amycolatopsis australiensis TaxID=546364 RepID=A0A1K1PFH9_9PSEU|nr:hypothetical protein [Amycolatopsis australiensis]SFW46528.1 hypothetical protein SAMN04489730_0585 [Amycolatopsis australiensis]
MDHHHDPVTGSSTVDVLAVLLRLAMLLPTAFLAGGGLLRPLVGELPRTRKLVLSGLGGLSALLAVVSAFAVDVNVVALAVHVVLAVAVPVLLRWPRAGRWASVALLALVVLETSLGGTGVEFALDSVFVAAAAVWFGFALLGPAVPPSSGWRPGPLAITLGGLLVLAGAVRSGLSGLGFDRRLYTTVFGVVVVALVVLPVAVSVLAAVRRDRAYRLGAIGVALGFLAWSALGAIPAPPPLPVPGVPLLAGGPGFPVLVSPQRPGHNVVHFPASAGGDLAAGVRGGIVTKAVARPGAEGTWADVELPPGRSDLEIRRGDTTTVVEVDAGDAPGPPITDADAPECASAALGGLVAGRADVLTSCPSDALTPEDAGALVKLVEFLGERKPSGITLVGDGSPRGVAAAKLVRDTAARAGLAVRPDAGPDTALVVVAGWAAGYTAMTRAAELQRLQPTHQYGLYLAPWLLNGPIVNAVASASLPLRFDPREATAVGYAVAVGDRFGGESPTVGGFRNWLGAGHPAGDVQIFAAAQVNAMPMYPTEPHATGMVMDRDYAGQWVPDGTIVPITSVLR